jgi:hypothetical protein
MTRATDLMDLHSSVKEHIAVEGGHPGLDKARADVARVRRELGL